MPRKSLIYHPETTHKSGIRQRLLPAGIKKSGITEPDAAFLKLLLT
jgi:hypothetical protein